MDSHKYISHEQIVTKRCADHANINKGPSIKDVCKNDHLFTLTPCQHLTNPYPLCGRPHPLTSRMLNN